jgi:hypothetical protein
VNPEARNLRLSLDSVDCISHTISRPEATSGLRRTFAPSLSVTSLVHSGGALGDVEVNFSFA